MLERPHDALFDCPFLSARIYTICAYSAIPSIPYPTARPRLSLSTSSASLSENAGITVNRSATFERSDRSDFEVVTRECSCADSGEGRAEGKLAIGGFRGKRSKLSSIWSQVGRRSLSRTPLDSDLFTSICCSTMAQSDKDSIDTYGDEEQLVSLAVHEPLRCRGRPAMRERESRSAS